MACNEDTAEANTFRSQIAELVTGIQNPQSLADHLFAKRIIALQVWQEIGKETLTTEQKTRKLLECVYTSIISIDPKHFRVFVDILRQEAYAEQLVKNLELEYRSNLQSQCSHGSHNTLDSECPPGSSTPGIDTSTVPRSGGIYTSQPHYPGNPSFQAEHSMSHVTGGSYMFQGYSWPYPQESSLSFSTGSGGNPSFQPLHSKCADGSYLYQGYSSQEINPFSSVGSGDISMLEERPPSLKIPRISSGPEKIQPLSSGATLSQQHESVSTEFSKYHDNIKTCYSKSAEVHPEHFPPIKQAKCINLALLDRGQLDEYSLHTIQRSADDIFAKKKKFSFDDLISSAVDGARILIEGRPGCGKTTLMSMVSREWAQEKILRRVTMLLLVPLRRFHNKEDLEFKDILKLYDVGPLVEKVNNEIALCGGQNLCILLDGIDEYSYSSSQGGLILGLMQRTLLPNCIVIATSRPASSHFLRIFADKRAEILGFLRHQIHEYIEEYYKDRDDKATALFTYLENYPNIRHMCYLPLHLAIIVYLNETLQQSMPKTETDVYLKFTNSILLRDMKRTADPNTPVDLSNPERLPTERLSAFRKICKLAYIGTVDSHQIFSGEDLMKIFGNEGMQFKLLGILISDKESILFGLEETYSFAHLTLQEFLAAYHLMRCPDAEQIQVIENFGERKSMTVVWKFYCGLTQLKSEASVQVFKIMNEQVESCVMLDLIHCVHEALNSSCCSELVASRNGSIIIEDETLTPSDIIALAYCIHNAFNVLSVIKLCSCHWNDEEISLLSSHVTVNPNIKRLCFEHTPVRKKAIPLFVGLLEKFPSVETLVLEGNGITDDAVDNLVGLLKALKDLQQLNLSGNHLTAIGSRTITEALNDNQNLRIQTDFIPEDDPDDSVQRKRMQEAKYLKAVDDAIKKKGKLEQTIAQGVFIGPPRNGKSSLMKRLLNLKLPSRDVVENPSTDVAENVIQVMFKKPSMSTADISSESTGLPWRQLSFDDEVIKLLKTLSDSVDQQDSFKNEPVEVTEMVMTSETQCEVGHTRDMASEKLDVVEICAETEHQSLIPTSTVTASAQAIPVAKFKTPQEIFKESLSKGWSEAKKVLENVCTMYLTDTGGQLEFQELHPALVSGPSIFFLVFRLDWDLNSEFPVYYSHSEKGESNHYQTNIKLKDSLFQSLASIAAIGMLRQQMNEELQPKVLFIGTHKDKVTKDKIKMIDKELLEAVKQSPFYQKGLVKLFNDARSPSVLLTVNNLSDNDDDSGIKQVRKQVELIIHQEDFKVTAPRPWLIFGIVLRQSVDQPVISYEQCSSLASECGIDDNDELNKALWFLSSRMGLIRYYHDASEDLKNLIILDPSIIFRKISELVIETFTFGNISNPSVCTKFVEKGLFCLDEFVKITKKSENDLLTASIFIDLLQHLHIIAQVHMDGETDTLFMPCILKTTSCPDSEASKDPGVPPLLFCFDCGYCPFGVFPALVAYLLNHNNEKELEYPWILQEDEIYKNQISFSVGACTVSLKSALTYIKVSYIPNDPHLHTTCNKIRTSLEQGLRQVTSDLYYTMDPKWGFFCQHCKLHEGHGAELQRQTGIPDILLCQNTGKSSMPPTGYHVWFSSAPGSIPLATSTGPGSDHPQTTPTTLSAGYSKLQCKRDKIISSLAELGLTRELAEKLLRAKMISQRIYDEAKNFAPGVVEVDRASVLFNAVLANVGLNAANFETFISILKEIRGSNDLVAVIEAAQY